jgi:hypothetical protein
MPYQSKKYCPVFLIFILYFFIGTSCSDRKADMKEIKSRWKNYVEYNANNLGKESVKLIDSSSISYYANMLSLIQDADSLTVEQLRLDQKILVLGIRLATSKKKIQDMKDGGALFTYCVQIGLIGSRYDDEKTYMEVLSINNNVAKTQLVDSNNKPGLLFEFRKENGKWLINLTKAYSHYGDDTWKTLIKESGKTEREYLYSILELMSKEKPTNSIWYPTN